MDKKFFFLKLLPPRPTFAMDMNEQERAVMMQHIAYWKVYQDQGICPVIGPVFDPKGGYGMGIMEVESEDVVKELTSNDPVIKAGLGTYEFYPMRAVFGKKL